MQYLTKVLSAVIIYHDQQKGVAPVSVDMGVFKDHAL
jgi:hypothetical protein